MGGDKIAFEYYKFKGRGTLGGGRSSTGMKPFQVIKQGLPYLKIDTAAVTPRHGEHSYKITLHQ